MGTTIWASEELADYLYERKRRGESYEDVIWRLIGEREGGPQHAEDASGAVPDRSPTDHAPAAHGADSGPTTEPTVDDVIANVRVPGSGAKAADRRDAVRAAVEYLRERGEATPADFQRDVYPDHRGHYTEGKNPPRSWWKNAIYPALREIAERGEWIEKADTQGEWAWIGDGEGDGR